MAHLPQLRRVRNTWELLVDGKPYLLFAAELHNSSMSSARYMNTVWQKLVDMGINTVLGAVSWEDIEPEEGSFYFAELDAVLAGARSHGLRLVLTWFGSFKNGMSIYTPPWVKTNPERFPRMQLRRPDGGFDTSAVVSIFHPACWEADSRAFQALMEHLKHVDTERTVIMVQVENEVGLLQDSRDGSMTATTIFNSAVPEELLDFLMTDWDCLRPELKSTFPEFLQRTIGYKTTGRSGSWEECFGKSVYTDEIFMAYHYAKYVDAVALAGRRVYNIPMFTNVWLPNPGQHVPSGNVASGGAQPGNYPSGGAVSTVLDVWLRFSPSIDFIAPDIYSVDYVETCALYRHRNQPLFIPEQRRDEYGARRIWEAFGSYGALGVSPFGIDTLEPEASSFTKHYRLLASVATHLLKARSEPDSLTGFFFDEIPDDGGDPPPTVRRLGSYDLYISRALAFGNPGPGFGMIIMMGPSRFLLVGMGFKVVFCSTSSTSTFTGILRFEEKSVIDAKNGILRTERILNGDETRSGKWANMPSPAPNMGTAFIPMLIPARTMIAEVEVYSLDSA